MVIPMLGNVFEQIAFEWDDEKATANAAKHAITFGEAIAIWADSKRVVEVASRPEDGEHRSRVIGLIEGRLFIAVYTLRNETIRIISARRANKREAKVYDHH